MIDFLIAEVKESFLPGHKLYILFSFINNYKEDFFKLLTFIVISFLLGLIYLFLQKFTITILIKNQLIILIKKISRNKEVLFSLILFLLIVFTYRNLFKTYFQGDEWYFAQIYLPFTKSWSLLFSSIPYSIMNLNTISGGGHLTPISNFLFPLSFKIFGFNYWMYALASIVLHTLNTVLIAFLCWKLFPKFKRYGYYAALFFAVSQVHSEAITWVFFYHMSLLSVTFFLLAFLKLIDIQKKIIVSKKEIFFFIVLSTAALLTKETTVILFPTFLIYILLTSKKRIITIYQLASFRALLVVGLFFIPFRLLIPQLIPKAEIVNPAPEVLFNVPLTIFRIITYPLKTLSEVFFSPITIHSWIESLTPLAYPYFAIEQEVRGTNYLMFIQTVGSDLFIYSLSVALLFTIILLFLKWKKNLEIKTNIIIAVTIILISPLPLLMVALYAPAFAYVTFFDSRHLYIPSIGAAILFSIAITSLQSSKKNIHKMLIFVPGLILFGWVILNYSLIQQDLIKKEVFGKERTTLLNTIISSLPKDQKKIVIYIDSNSSYYGFADLMPPFQTNFGQVLTDILYHQNQLPKELLDTSYLTKKGITAQGFKKFEDYAFGYFLSINKVHRLIEQGQINIEDVYSFMWDGKTIRAENNTDTTRKRLIDLQKESAKYKDWQKIVFSELNMSFKIPKEAQIIPDIGRGNNSDHLAITTFQKEDDLYIMRIIKRTGTKGIYEDISDLNDSTGNIIGNNFYYRTVKMISGETTTIKVTSNGSYTKYFIPTIFPDKIIELSALNFPAKIGGINPEAETILSLIQYPEIE